MEIYKEVPEKFHNQFMETVAILEQKNHEKEPDVGALEECYL